MSFELDLKKLTRDNVFVTFFEVNYFTEFLSFDEIFFFALVFCPLLFFKISNFANLFLDIHQLSCFLMDVLLKF